MKKEPDLAIGLFSFCGEEDVASAPRHRDSGLQPGSAPRDAIHGIATLCTLK